MEIGDPYATLPRRGPCLVVPDLHGNLDDFVQVCRRFTELLSRAGEAHLAFLGDLVHGPDDEARRRMPELYGFSDRSWEVVEGVEWLIARHPGRVHLVLGNHDHGHIGGPHTSKFHADEVTHLEQRLTANQVSRLRALFRGAHLLLLAPCGVLLSHGSPGQSLRSLTQLDDLCSDLSGVARQAALDTILRSYGQTGEVTRRMLARLSAGCGFDLDVVIHGHDRDEDGCFSEGGNQLCPVLFGASDPNKRVVQLDLSARYRSTDDLRPGREIVRLYPPDTGSSTEPRPAAKREVADATDR